MDSLSPLVAFLLAAMGLTVLVIWPEGGPSGWLRERVLRRVLPGKSGTVLDCYVCLGFWSGLALSPLWWWWTGQSWYWAGCLMVPALFWMFLHSVGHSATSASPGNSVNSEVTPSSKNE